MASGTWHSGLSIIVSLLCLAIPACKWLLTVCLSTSPIMLLPFFVLLFLLRESFPWFSVPSLTACANLVLWASPASIVQVSFGCLFQVGQATNVTICHCQIDSFHQLIGANHSHFLARDHHQDGNFGAPFVEKELNSKGCHVQSVPSSKLI